MFVRSGRAAATRLPVLCVLFVGLAACAPDPTPPLTPNTPSDIATLRRLNQPLQALFLVESQASANGWTSALAREAGDLWNAAGDPSRALDFWQLAATADTTSRTLAARVAQGAIELQRWPEAVTALDLLLTLNPDDAWSHLQLGLIRAAFDPSTASEHLRAARREPAYEALALALINAGRDAPDLPKGMAVGLVLARLEQWPFAELAFQQAAALAAPYPAALAYTALARDQQGKPAERWMSEAVALAPDDALVRFLQGLHLRTTGDLLGSLDALAQAVSIAPENPAYHAELGSAYRLLNDLPHAEYWLTSAVRVSNDDPRFVELLAQFHADEGDPVTGASLSADPTPITPALNTRSPALRHVE